MFAKPIPGKDDISVKRPDHAAVRISGKKPGRAREDRFFRIRGQEVGAALENMLKSET